MSVCSTSDFRQAPMHASSFRAGTITDTAGRRNRNSGATIGRILYYICVRRASVLIGLILLLLPGCYSGSRPPRIGSAAPDFTVQDSDRKVTLSELRGKIVILNFWATWCPPCIEELPSLIQLNQKIKDKGIIILGVSIDVDADAYHKFLQDRKIEFLTVRDGDQKSSNLYGTFKYPETYIIDRNGVVRRKFIGAVDWTSPEIMDFLTKL
jgi:cytochrome c biogenesis protein CcmG, thiol:disulfide interchange protein DsbE